LAERLKARRIAAGLFRRQLARAAGVSESTVSQIERGLIPGTPPTLAKVAHVLGEL
jgi:transcriptional regulator with XRE-family HTH domain